jgi:hypothetical protein
VSSEPGPVFPFCAAGLISGVLRTSGLVFLFCVPGIVFSVSEGFDSRFLVLRAHTRFRWYRGRQSCFHVLRVQTHFLRYRGRVSFSCFTLPDSFSTVSGRRVSFSCFARLDSFLTIPGASGLVFKFCAPRLVFDGSGGVGSRFHVLRIPSCFHVLRAQTRFQRYRGRRVPVFMFCALGFIFGGTEGVGSRFHVLRSRTRFWRYRGRRVSCSCFARPNSFSAVPRVSGPVFIFCAPGLVFGGTEGVVSRFHVLCSRTRFRRFRGHLVRFPVFAPQYSFLAVPRASCPVFMFCAPQTCFRRYRGRRVLFLCFELPDSFFAVPSASGPVFMFCAPELVFGVTEGVGILFHVLRSQTRFRRYRGYRVPFSCFALQDSFSAVRWASGPFFIFCAPGLIFGGTEGVPSRFHVFRSRSCFRRYRGRRVPFSCFLLRDSFSAIPRS